VINLQCGSDKPATDSSDGSIFSAYSLHTVVHLTLNKQQNTRENTQNTF